MLTNKESLHFMWCLTGTMEYVISISISFSSWLCVGVSWCLLLRWSCFSSPAPAGSTGRIPACSLQVRDSARTWPSNLSSSSVSSLCRSSRNARPAVPSRSSAPIPTSSARKTPLLSFMSVPCFLVLHCRSDLDSETHKHMQHISEHLPADETSEGKYAVSCCRGINMSKSVCKCRGDHVMHCATTGIWETVKI